MNPFGNMPDVPTTAELWKDEKTKYRHWIILFGVGILAMFALVVTGFIMSQLDKDNIRTELTTYLTNHNRAKLNAEGISDVVDHFMQNRLFIYPIVKMVSLAVAGVLYIQTVIESYKKKSFATLSYWSTFVVGIVALFGGYELLQMIWGDRLIFSFSTGIYMFVGYILAIAIWAGFSIQLGKIRRIFMISERMDAIKNSPQFEEMMNGGQTMAAQANPFMGPMMGGVRHQVQPKAKQGATAQPKPNEPQKPVELTPEQKRTKELEKLTVVELQEVAKKLSISGFSTMKKNELIKAIIRVSGDA